MKQGQALALVPCRGQSLCQHGVVTLVGTELVAVVLCSTCDAQAEPTLLGWEQGEIPLPTCGIGACGQSRAGVRAR